MLFDSDVAHQLQIYGYSSLLTSNADSACLPTEAKVFPGALKPSSPDLIAQYIGLTVFFFFPCSTWRDQLESAQKQVAHLDYLLIGWAACLR